MNDDWMQDTTDVLHCSMPPQVRQHIEELRDEVARLRAAEVPLSANRGFAVVIDDNCGDPFVSGVDGVGVIPSADEARVEAASDPAVTPVALIPLAAWDRT